MNEDYWVTTAQISATFIGLVFVAFSLYLNGIREAIASIDRLFGANSGLQEKSSYLLTTSVLSNLTYFVLPLTTALLITSSRFGYLFLLFYLILNATIALLFFVLYFSKRVRLERFTILSERSKEKWLWFRLTFGNLLIILFILIFSFLAFEIFYNPLRINENLVNYLAQVTSFLSMILGLVFGLFDLKIFDTDYVLFQVSSDFENMLDILCKELYSEVFSVEQKYQQFLLSIEGNVYRQNLENISKERPNDLISIDHEEMLIRDWYDKVRREVPKGDNPPMVLELRQKGVVLSSADLHSLLKRRFSIRDKSKLLKQKIVSWLEKYDCSVGDKSLSVKG